MKLIHQFICLAALTAILSCNKPITEYYYASTQDFYSQNGVPMQAYTINGNTGGIYTSPQGTVVNIPANAFVTQTNMPVTGAVTIEFKDIYKKSDMLLSNMPTMTGWGTPLKSGGECFIKASFNNEAVLLAPGKQITIQMPNALTGADLTNTMQPFVAFPDSMGGGLLWSPSSSDSVYINPVYYIYNLSMFNSPGESGTWINCDNESYFSTYAQTSLTFHPTDELSAYQTQIFLIFNSISTVVSMWSSGGDFTYSNAPQGLQCTMVMVAIKDGNLSSCFLPVTIGANQTYNFTISQTSIADFKTQVEALN